MAGGVSARKLALESLLAGRREGVIIPVGKVVALPLCAQNAESISSVQRQKQIKMWFITFAASSVGLFFKAVSGEAKSIRSRFAALNVGLFFGDGLPKCETTTASFAILAARASIRVVPNKVLIILCGAVARRHIMVLVGDCSNLLRAIETNTVAKFVERAVTK